MNAAQPKTAGLAIAALVCAFLCFPLGVILAIVALIKISGSKGALGGKGLAIAALILSLAWIPMSGIMAAIAIPNFVKFQCKSKQSMAKVTLSSLHVAQEAHHAETDSYGAASDIGFQAASGGFYSFEVTSHDANSYQARAVGQGDMTGDIWQVDQRGQPENISNACR